MNGVSDIPEPLPRLIDEYVSGLLDESGVAELDRLLRDSAAGRAYFVRYCRLETDLHAAAKARQAGERALGRIVEAATPPQTPAKPRRFLRLRTASRRLLVAALLLVSTSGGVAWLALRGRPASDAAVVARLVNAQDCEWDGPSDGAWTAGRALRIRRGLAEVRMAGGATALLEGPADVELVSRDCLRLTRGKLSVRAPGQAKGFQVLLPQGRVVDLGTEFGVRVAEDGTADVRVFEGQVEAYPQGSGEKVALGQSQTARVARGEVKVDPPALAASPPSFARQIERSPVPVARRVALDFTAPRDGTLADGRGAGTGLTRRLPGTGAQLPARDPNLLLDPAKGELRLTTTRSDINHRFRLPEGEYLGLRLADLGFTGSEDFEVSVVVPNIPSLAAVGQFGLYAGPRCDRCIRGGLISQRTPNRYSQFLVNNEAGIDYDASYVGLVAPGNDVRVTLRRREGRYGLTVENLSSGASSTLSIRRAPALDDERDMYVGLFGANTGSEERQTLSIVEFSATVWTKE